MPRCCKCNNLMNSGNSYSFLRNICGTCKGKEIIAKLKDEKELSNINYDNRISEEKKRWGL